MVNKDTISFSFVGNKELNKINASAINTNFENSLIIIYFPDIILL